MLVKYIASISSPDPRQGWWPCIKWCEEYLINKWDYQGEGVFDFYSETDYTMFLLKWS